MNRSVLIYGPQGCGKTNNSARLAKHFGLSRVVDSGHGINEARECLRPVSHDTLYLASDAPRKVEGIVIMSFAEAMKEMNGGKK